MSVPAAPASASRSKRRRARPRIVIAGLGLLTPIGHAAWPTFAALLAGRTISDRAAPLIEAEGNADGAQVIDPVSLVRALGAVSVVQHAATDPAIELADRVAREAAFAAGVETHQLPTYLGTSKGAVHALTRCGQHASSLSDTTARTNQFCPESTRLHTEPIALGPHGYISHHLQHRLDVLPQTHVVAACASALTALDQARRALEAGAPKQAPPERDAPAHALVVTAEAALLPQFIHSYRRLGVLAPLTPRDYRQRPLDGDARRRGFMLTEAGAAVLLKRLPPETAPAPGEIELLDTAAAAEAHDLVRSDPAMPALRHVAERLLGSDRLGPRRVDVIHPHAPGTIDHDPAELRAYREVLGAAGADMTDLYACKGALGHSLGASGLVSLVLACLCLHAGRRPPMPWLDAPLPGVIPEGRPCARTGTHAIFAAGFGGHVAGAVIRRH